MNRSTSTILATLLTLVLALGAGGGCSDDQGPGAGSGDTADGTTAPDTGPDVIEGDTLDEDTGLVDVLDPEDTADSGADTLLADTLPITDTLIADTTPPIPDPDVVVDLANTCSPEGGARNIYDIQNPDCPDHITPEPTGSPGFYVELSGVVVSAIYSDIFFVQELAGGPYSGIAVFAHGAPPSELAVGDLVDVTGDYSEHFENSQIYLETVTKKSAGTPPAPYVIAHPAWIQTNGPIPELFEGVLVRVEDVKTVHTRPDCPSDYGEFAITSNLRVDDLGFRWTAHIGDEFSSITGPLHYTFGNFKLEPRDASDVVATAVGNAASVSKCVASECRAPLDAVVTHRVIINEIMPDPFGSDLNQEWFELYNPGSEPVNVNGWQIRDCGDQALEFAGPNLTIPARGYLVVGMSSNSSTNGGVPVDLAYGNSFYLPNTLGAILLYDSTASNAVLVDNTRYSAFPPWTAFQPGKSLERINATGDGTSETNWKAGKTKFGTGDNRGTPGKRNSAAQ